MSQTRQWNALLTLGIAMSITCTPLRWSRLTWHCISVQHTDVCRAHVVDCISKPFQSNDHAGSIKRSFLVHSILQPGKHQIQQLLHWLAVYVSMPEQEFNWLHMAKSHTFHHTSQNIQHKTLMLIRKILAASDADSVKGMLYLRFILCTCCQLILGPVPPATTNIDQSCEGDFVIVLSQMQLFWRKLESLLLPHHQNSSEPCLPGRQGLQHLPLLPCGPSAWQLLSWPVV